MIIGIGTDITDVARIRALLEKHEERFAEKYFTPIERERAAQTKDEKHRAFTYAKRWAAKEACAKALGLGIRDGVAMQDIGVENDAHGRPSLRLEGGALERLESLIPHGKTLQIHLSLSDDGDYAQAFVVIEAL